MDVKLTAFAEALQGFAELADLDLTALARKKGVSTLFQRKRVLTPFFFQRKRVLTPFFGGCCDGLD